jgi:BirA family biotin operon repressor/biotin-[acetyl-CoA-carboxylase] ligase
MSINWRFEQYQNVVTTQNYVFDAIDEGEAEGFVVQALQQQGGKGRHGNKWEAPIGNLYISALLRPECDLASAGQLAFVVAVALSDALDAYIDPEHHVKTLKWPNDILIDGRKISGILLESDIKDNALNAIVLGVGVNIFKAPEFGVALNDIASEPVYVNKVRDVILDKLSYYLDLWQEKGFAPIREAWLNGAHGIGKPMTARLPSESFKGIFKGITEDGSLILDMDGTDKIIHAAEVHFGPDEMEKI